MSETFGPRVVEGGAKKRWFAEAKALWKNSWSGMIPMALTLGLLLALFYNTELMRTTGYFIFLPVLSLVWQVIMVKTTYLTAEGKRVGFGDVFRSLIQMYRVPRFFWISVLKRFSYVLIAALFGVFMVTLSLYLTDQPYENAGMSKVLFFEGNKWLAQIYQVGSGWGLFLAMAWILTPSGTFSFVNLLALDKGMSYQEAYKIDVLALRENPILANIGLVFLQMGLISMLLSIVPFGFILVVLLETFGTCYLVVAYRDVFNQGGLKELEKEEALIESGNSVPNL